MAAGVIISQTAQVYQPPIISQPPVMVSSIRHCTEMAVVQASPDQCLLQAPHVGHLLEAAPHHHGPPSAAETVCAAAATTTLRASGQNPNAGMSASYPTPQQSLLATVWLNSLYYVCVRLVQLKIIFLTVP